VASPRMVASDLARAVGRDSSYGSLVGFFAPFAPYFHPVLGRPSTPVECYLRLMFLKYQYRLGYERLCAEVSDSISWRRFCRIPLDATVPHPTTLMKLTTRGTAARP
jgi:transposase, IS5 family